MSKYKFLSETPTEEEGKHLYSLEVTAVLGEDNTVTQVQEVIFDADKCKEQAQEYADQMESELKEQDDARVAAEKQAAEAPSK